MEGKGEGRTEVKGKIFGDASTASAGRLECHFLWQGQCSAPGLPLYNLCIHSFLMFDPIL